MQQPHALRGETATTQLKKQHTTSGKVCVDMLLGVCTSEREVFAVKRVTTTIRQHTSHTSARNALAKGFVRAARRHTLPWPKGTT